MTAFVSRVLPPGRVLRLVAVLVGVIVAVVLACWWWGGVAVGVAAALGAIAVLVLALHRPPWLHVVGFVVLVGAGAAAATAIDGAWALGTVVALTVAATAPFVLRHGPIVSSAPVVIAAAGTEVADIGPGAAFAGVAAAGLLTAISIAVLGLRVPAAPLPRRDVLLAYIVALALGSGLAVGVTVAVGLSHAIWIIIAMSAVLVPVAGETTRRARARVGGTIVGVLAATLVAQVLPGGVNAALAAGLLVLGIAWVIAKEERRGGAMTAAAVVLVYAAGQDEAAWEVAAWRAGLTLVGGVLAALLALAIARLERRGEAVGGAPA